ncbi:hypothetical protein Purlil1_3533 [Purpureocillium lilacinum]|uniref:Uncharacterized protein n=1 Tax=Purpureocillium lilacinum TaxID=33203 RepID=A0ABR0C7R9_PURLI|nr:hypothetical protein Purlil1_3533 [Purpureocillium lilacinum]
MAAKAAAAAAAAAATAATGSPPVQETFLQDAHSHKPTSPTADAETRKLPPTHSLSPRPSRQCNQEQQQHPRLPTRAAAHPHVHPPFLHDIQSIQIPPVHVHGRPVVRRTTRPQKKAVPSPYSFLPVLPGTTFLLSHAVLVFPI